MPSRETAHRNREPADAAHGPSVLLPDAPQLEAALSTSQMGLWQLDLGSRVLACTERCKTHFGIGADEELDCARLLGGLIHPDDGPRLRGAVQAAITTRTDCDIECRVVRPGGGLHWVGVRGRAEFDATGKALRMAGVTLDVTERKRAEQLATEQSRLLEMVASGCPRADCLEGISAVVGALHPGVRACVVLANETRDAVAELVCTQLPGEFGERLVGTPLDNLPIGARADALHGGEPFSCNDVAGSPDGPDEWRALCNAHGIRAYRSTPVFDHGGRAIGSFLMCFGTPHEADAWEMRLSIFGAHLISMVHERDRTHRQLQRSEARVQAELHDSRLLQHLSVELAHHDDAPALYEKILDAAVAIMGSGSATMQVLHAGSGELHLLAFRGFDPAHAATWKRIAPDSASACGEAFRRRQRVVVADVERWPPLAGSEDLAACRRSGVRSVQATPLFTRDGRLLGMLSTHWGRPHVPAERDLRLLDILCRQAADLLERQQSVAALRTSETRYQSLFEWMDEGFCVVEVLFDDQGRARDYRFLETNPAFARHTGLQDAQGRCMRELAPDHEEYWFEIYGEVARSGQPVRFIREAAALDRWYEVFAYPVGHPDAHTVGVLFTDVTARKQGEDALRESEERFRLMADHSPMMVWMTDAGGDCTFLSQSWYEFTGQDDGGGLARGWLQHVHPEDRGHVHEATAEAKERGGPFRVEYRLRHRDGQYRWVLAAARPRVDRSGRVLGHIGSLLDIQERRQAEDDMRFLVDLGERIRQVRDVDRLVADTTRALGRYLQVTRCYFAEVHEDGECWRIAQDYHRGHDSLAGDRPIPLFGPALDAMRDGRMLVAEDTSADAASAEHHEAVYAPMGVRSHAVVPLLRGGQWRANLVVADDRPRQWSTRELGLLETVAERAWNARERLQTELALREADRRKDEFLAMLAHELRNPLAPLRNCLQILRMADQDRVDGRQLHEVMERQLTQLVRLVDDLLEVSRITRGKVALKPEPVELAEVIERAVETSRPVIDERAHALVVDLPRHPVRLMADPVRLAQVVSNLLNNAAKYTEPGGRIVLAARRDSEEAILTVHDNGLGIAPEHLGDVFDLFSQADHSLSRAQGGLGIGLTLVRNLVELHGGRVAVRSEGLGQGSEFEVRLPLQEIEQNEAGREEPAPHSAQDLRHRVLVVDDNREHADSLALLLDMSGHHVRTAYDGAEGVSAAETFDPDAVLLDIGMPKLDGYEACRRIRAQPGGDDRVLIAVTGWGQEEDRRRGQAAGFDAHLVKPVDPAGLLQVMDTLHRARHPG